MSDTRTAAHLLVSDDRDFAVYVSHDMKTGSADGYYASVRLYAGTPKGMIRREVTKFQVFRDGGTTEVETTSGQLHVPSPLATSPRAGASWTPAFASGTVSLRRLEHWSVEVEELEHWAVLLGPVPPAPESAIRSRA